jgi:hypothetical protein
MSSHPHSPEGMSAKIVRIDQNSGLSIHHVTPMSSARPVAVAATVATDMATKNAENAGVKFYDCSNNADNGKIITVMNQVENKSHKQDIATSTNTLPSTVETYTSMYDPHSFPFSETMPPHTYCLDCCCPTRFCHYTLFGHYLECQVVNKTAMKTMPCVGHQVKSIYNRHFTALLQFKIFKMEGVLDIAIYKLPDCIVSCSLQSLLKYLHYRTYHIYKHSCIVNGGMVSRKLLNKRRRTNETLCEV